MGRIPRRSQYMYGREWASAVVEDFQRAYPRGWFYAYHLRGEGHFELFQFAVHCVRLREQSSWERLKRAVKQLEVSPPPPLPRDAGRKYYTYVQRMAFEDAHGA